MRVVNTAKEKEGAANNGSNYQSEDGHLAQGVRHKFIEMLGAHQGEAS